MDCQEICDFWFNNEELWFNATPKDDELIKQKYSKYLNENMTFNDYQLKNMSKTEILANVILLDQFVRHIFRNNKELINKYHKISLELSYFVLNNNLDNQFNPPEKCFILMPIRHTFEIDKLKMLLDKVNNYRKEDNSKYFIRFYKSTLIALSNLITSNIYPEDLNLNISNNEIYSILDKESVKNLENIQNLNKTDILDKDEELYKTFKLSLNKIKGLKEITLSLSGGVDSMVSSYILYHLSENQKKFKIIAVNIDYGNRGDICNVEVEFVKRWCKLLNIDVYVRHINEIKRDRTLDRDLYEKITRFIRFSMYKKFNNPVVIGHNLDDCLENIFSNIKKSRSFNNLRGMSEFSSEDNCTIVRPMLNIPKKNIIEFAKKYKIPYLTNSTPSWSERGKIRENLIPLIENFDPLIIKGLLKLSDNVEKIYQIYDKSIVNNFFDNVKFNVSPNVTEININLINDDKNFGFVFWKDILVKIFHKINSKIPSNKSIETFCKRIEKNQYGIIKLSDGYEFLYGPDLLKFIYKNNQIQ